MEAAPAGDAVGCHRATPPYAHRRVPGLVSGISPDRAVPGARSPRGVWTTADSARRRTPRPDTHSRAKTCTDAGSTSQTKTYGLAALRDQHRQLRLIIRTGLDGLDLVHDHRDGVEHLAEDDVLPSSHSHFPQVMKNWLPFVSGPELPSTTTPVPECLRLKFSSANAFAIYTDTARPSPFRMSPPWIMNSLMTRWKGVFSTRPAANRV